MKNKQKRVARCGLIGMSLKEPGFEHRLDLEVFLSITVLFCDKESNGTQSLQVKKLVDKDLLVNCGVIRES
jgi:hypothetical protein